MYTMQDFWQDDFYKQCSPDSLFDCDDCVLTDVNLSEASEDAMSKKFPGYTTLHSDGDSYPNSPINDMDTDFADSMMTVNPSDVKVEPPSPSSTPALIPLHNHVVAPKQEPETVQIKQEPRQTSVLKNPTIVITGGRNSTNPNTTTRLLVPKLPNNTTVKLESGERWRIGSTKILVSNSQGSIKTRRTIDSHLISSSNSTGADGELYLTEEEKRTLVSEGYSIPKKLPLSKAEERSLKKIRRKIKNKISAQESRRKKKEYLDLLERKYEALQEERDGWMRKCEELQMQNKELQTQLTGLRSQIIEFDDVVVGTAHGGSNGFRQGAIQGDTNRFSKDDDEVTSATTISEIMSDNEKTMLPDIPDPFDIDVD